MGSLSNLFLVLVQKKKAESGFFIFNSFIQTYICSTDQALQQIINTAPLFVDKASVSCGSLEHVREQPRLHDDLLEPVIGQSIYSKLGFKVEDGKGASSAVKLFSITFSI